MNGSLTIRPAVITECGRLAVLWKGVESLHHQAFPHIFCEPDDGWPTFAAVEKLVAGPDSTILVAEANDDIAGFIGLKVYRVERTPRMRERHFVMIENMAVDPLRRRSGIGRALLKGAEDWTAQRGIALLQLFVWEFNDAALRFYESEGFVTELRGMARRIAE